MPLALQTECADDYPAPGKTSAGSVSVSRAVDTWR